jgi:methionine synthase II (cobalamin-independent)
MSFKLFRIESGKELSEDFKKSIEDLKQEWTGKQEDAKLKILMMDTRINRRNWVMGKSITEVLEAFPCLEQGSFVSVLYLLHFFKGELGRFQFSLD